MSPLVRRALLVFVLAVLPVAAACSDDSSVGQGVDTDFEEQLNEQLGATTTTSTTAPVAGDDDGQATATTAGNQATTTTSISGFEIRIDGVGFAPVYSRVLPGTIITFKNNDTQTRSAVADNGEFDTGDIGPGGSATWTAPDSGTINFSDGSRPFVTGTIEVTTG